MSKQNDTYVKGHADITNTYTSDSSIGNQIFTPDMMISFNLPHHASASHPRMPLDDRAAQFAPFAALTGHSTAIRNTAEAVEEEMQLGKDVTAAGRPCGSCFMGCVRFK